jgi:oxygen-independent coproporphyrinogen-3 oxidase
VNRVSLGVQALNDADLKFLGREHSAREALDAIEIAASIFDRYSFDLIYARPNQTCESWAEELKQALSHARGHLSLYQLTIERGTPFHMRYHRGEFKLPDDVEGAEFYHVTQDVLEAAGLPAYEVSNHATPGQESRHNLMYWHYGDYIGIGPGAHGRFVQGDKKFATRDHSVPELWLEKVREHRHGAHPWEEISSQDRFAEGLMMGLRLPSGVSWRRLEFLSGETSGEMIHQDNLKRLEGEGWVVLSKDGMRLTREGLLRLNAIVPYILI